MPLTLTWTSPVVALAGLSTGLLLLASAGNASAHAVRAAIALDGARHLEAFGIPANELQSRTHKVPAQLPWAIAAPPSPTAASAAAASLVSELERMLEGIAGPSGPSEQASECIPTGSKVFTGCANFTCVACVNTTAAGAIQSSNASCTVADNGSHGKVARTSGGANITQTILHAYIQLGLMMGPLPDADCSCTGSLGFNGTVFTNCSFAAAVCEYIEPPADPNGVIYNVTARFRAKGFRYGQEQFVGLSKGWTAPYFGYAPDAAAEAATAALSNLKTEHPTTSCEKKVPPMVVIPGLTSSALNYKLTSSAPPAWAFWCERNTDGWEPLWPLQPDVTKSPTSFLCWAADIAVQYNPATNTFGPARKGCETELVDFGSFGGISALSILEPVFEMVGWTSGKDLFAAPYDWRVPSAGQGEFFSKLKALVEQVSADNGGQKVVLWAFSFGPQYTLSFLHRMTQPWKDQYIAWFVGSSPVWGGAPAALAAFLAGYTPFGAGPQPYPNPPKECKAYEMIEGACYTGPFRPYQAADLAACCDLVANTSSSIFNFFLKNGTCAVVHDYVATEPCADGVLGYHAGTSATGEAAVATTAAAPTSSATLVRTLAQASPSLMWAFPRPGTESNTSWTQDDVIVQTPSKNYTAFDIAELLADVDQAKNVDLYKYLSSESDLAALAAPGVDTYITYGTGTPTLNGITFDADFKKGKAAPTTGVTAATEDGDDLVPARSSVRGKRWAGAQAGLSKRLLYKAYAKQPHATCFVAPGLQTLEPAVECWLDVLGVLLSESVPANIATLN